jgi:hypothetical protein
MLDLVLMAQWDWMKEPNAWLGKMRRMMVTMVE